MKCPICNVDLVMSERQGIEIDYCPQCRGVWLDRGELDKIIERSAQLSAAPAPAQAQPAQQVPVAIQAQPAPQGFAAQPQPYQQSRRDDRNAWLHDSPEYGHGYSQHGGYRKKKRSGFLGDLFDFGD